MNNKQHQYSCISTYKTETCCNDPIILAGTEIFIDVNANPCTTTAELLSMQKELYMETMGNHVRYVDGKLMHHHNVRNRSSQGSNFIPVFGALSKKKIDKQVGSIIYSFSARFQRLTGICEGIKTEFQYFQNLSKEVKRRIEEGELTIQEDITLLEICHETDVMCAFSTDGQKGYNTVYLSPDGTINLCSSIESCGWRGGILYDGCGAYDEFYHKMFSNMETSKAFEPPKRCSTIVIENLEKILAGKLRL